jgi:hypothetical protein
MPSSPEITEWLPDWQDASQYPNEEETSLEQWAWEFLRRNSKYRNLWAVSFEENLELFNRALQLEATQLSDGSFAFVSSDQELKKVCQLADNFNYLFRLVTFPPHPSENRIALRFEGQRLIHKLGSSEISLSRNEAAIICNFDLPIKEQVAEIESFLKCEKQRRGLKEKRLRIEKYRTYLRILDAKMKYATDQDVATVIFPNEKNEYPEWRVSAKVRECLKAAEELRDHDFWMLAVKQN